MDQSLKTRMEKMLALTSSPNENEAKQAMEMLQALLTKHNLDIADLETRGQKAPGVKERAHDLGKAAFIWKLDLADTIASHYFCYPMVDRKAKTVQFVGRPDNVESLVALYRWVIEQIRTISRNERYVYIERTGEHIDPLRWQTQFGIGIVSRLGVRLDEIRRKRAEDANVNALVIHHESEISDWLEEKFGYRVDGQMTKERREAHERYEARKLFKAEMEAAGTMEEYYKLYPWERPLTGTELAESEERQRKSDEEWEKKWAKMQARQARQAYREPKAPRPMTEAQLRKMSESATANYIGQQSASKVNLTPFLKAGEKVEGLG